MLSPLWSTLRSIMFVLCFCILFGYAQSAHAGCEIKNVSFVGADYMLDDVPFFGGYRQPSSYKDVKITTNNDSSCENRKVYLTVFSRTQKNGDLGIPLDNIKNQEFVMKKLGDFAGAPEYGLAVSLYSGEEKCYSYGYDDLKRLITDGIKTGTRQKTEFEYLKNDPLTKDLYGFLFDDLTYSTNGGYVLNDYTMWTAKKLIHLKFGQAVECGYFARAKLDTEMNVAVAEEDGKPMARHSNDDYTNNNVGYMCNVSDYVYSIPNLPKDAIKTALGGSAGALIGAGAGASVASWAIVGTFVAPGVGTAVGAAAGLVVGLIVANEFTGFTDDVANLPSDVVEGIKQSVLDDYCESNTKWEVRNATSAFSPGALDPNDKCSINGTPTPGCYELLAPIPGLGTTINFDGINGQPPFALEQFFLAAINIIIGAISILAVLALMYYGYSMMRDRSRGNIAAISVDKTKLLNIFYGIGIILGSYVILNTINPELLVVAPNLATQTFRGESLISVSNSDFTAITGKAKFPKSEYYKLAAQVAQQVGVHECAVKVIIARESRGDPTAIGCDENVGNKPGIPSRAAFIQSGANYLGELIPVGTSYNSSVKNPCEFDKSKPGYGLDWRFSKGIGLTQMTLFPDGYFGNRSVYFSSVRSPDGSLWKKRTEALTRPRPDGKGVAYTVEYLLDPVNSLVAGAELFKYYLNKCNNNVLGAYRAYASGGCDGGGFALEEGAKRENMYNRCLAGENPE